MKELLSAKEGMRCSCKAKSFVNVERERCIALLKIYEFLQVTLVVGLKVLTPLSINKRELSLVICLVGF